VVDRARVGGFATGVIVSSGNANAATGPQGLVDARAVAALLAARAGVPEAQALVCSTGVIGVPLPVDKIREALPRIVDAPDGGGAFAEAIMTTDTRDKQHAVEIEIGGVPVRVGGCAKGAGMIHPNMATMLAFLTTDATITPALLQATLRQSVDATFNMIDVDGDKSTNDTVLLFANGAARAPEISAASENHARFAAAVREVCERLAVAIVADAEGGDTVFAVHVSGAASLPQARAVARRISSSLLVKTAVHGGDPNWGRIMAAAGDAGHPVDPAAMLIAIGGHVVYADGTPREFDRAAASADMKRDRVSLSVSLGSGPAEATAWGCNLSEGYVTFNSAYTT
jgi:glutamate N-acetyltransferase/amino-acid N-acetyltransferase